MARQANENTESRTNQRVVAEGVLDRPELERREEATRVAERSYKAGNGSIFFGEYSGMSNRLDQPIG